MSARVIDQATWPRRRHFAVFNAFDYPHINVCAPVDVTQLYPLVKARGLSVTVSVVYLLARAANEIAEFRTRIRGDVVVEHDRVHPSPTILVDDDLFSYCTIPFAPDFATFAASAARRIAAVRQNPTLEDEPGQDDLLYMTSLPWVAFTGLMHPIHMHPADSVPRIAWGKMAADGARRTMPLSVQAHHALLDGVHVGRYFERVETMLRQPEAYLD